MFRLLTRYRLIGDNGIELERVGSGREGQTYFSYFDRDFSFRFTAMDQYHEGGPVERWDHWEVYLGIAFKQFSPSADGPVSLGRAEQIARNISEALMAWPRYPTEPEIRYVKFQMKDWPTWNPTWEDWVTVDDFKNLEVSAKAKDVYGRDKPGHDG
jgi:hypothetical protein